MQYCGPAKDKGMRPTFYGTTEIHKNLLDLLREKIT